MKELGELRRQLSDERAAAADELAVTRAALDRATQTASTLEASNSQLAAAREQLSTQVTEQKDALDEVNERLRAAESGLMVAAGRADAAEAQVAALGDDVTREEAARVRAERAMSEMQARVCPKAITLIAAHAHHLRLCAVTR